MQEIWLSPGNMSELTEIREGSYPCSETSRTSSWGPVIRRMCEMRTKQSCVLDLVAVNVKNKRDYRLQNKMN